jgi:hypothetical protein
MIKEMLVVSDTFFASTMNPVRRSLSESVRALCSKY